MNLTSSAARIRSHRSAQITIPLSAAQGRREQIHAAEALVVAEHLGDVPFAHVADAIVQLAAPGEVFRVGGVPGFRRRDEGIVAVARLDGAREDAVERVVIAGIG
jgi:hypothetical protein